MDEYKNAPIKEHKVNAFLVGAELVSGPFSLGVDYSQKKATDDFDGIGYKFDKELHAEAIPFNKLRALEVGAKYKYLDNASLYGEYINGKATSADGEKYTKLNAYILGTDYWFTKSVVTYLEAGTFKYKNQASEKYNDNRVGVGFRVYF